MKPSKLIDIGLTNYFVSVCYYQYLQFIRWGILGLYIYIYTLYVDFFRCRVYCIVGDGESAEGSVWEGFNFASYYKLDNLVVIIDINRLGQNQETQLGYNMKSWKKRVDSFG